MCIRDRVYFTAFYRSIKDLLPPIKNILYILFEGGRQRMKSRKKDKKLIWFSRVTGILYALVLMLFSLDVFQSGGNLITQLGGFLIHSVPVSYTHLRAHETDSYLVCRLLLEKK